LKQYIIRISLITIVAFSLLFTGLSFLLVRQQQNSLHGELIGSRKTSLNHLVSNAVMPLLDEDALSLNSLLKDVKTLDGLVYGMIIDGKGVIRAHTDAARLGSGFTGFENIKDRRQVDETFYVTYGVSARKTILDISRPVVFMKRELGWVHLGVSSDFIKQQLAQHKAKSIRTLFLWGLAMLIVLIAGAMLLSLRWSKSESLWRRKSDKQNMWEPSNQGTFQRSRSDDYSGQEPNGTGDGSAGGQTQDMARNQVTVLFAGIKGFKAYAQTREPVRLMEDLNDYVSIATDCILKYGGYIDKFIGDAVIAVFASSPLETNHAERAINAAMEMQASFRKNPSDDNQLLSRVGIGISSGIVLSGTIGPEMKKELTFIGESFKVAYSLNVMAGPGEIIVSRDAYQLLKNSISVEPLPPREMMQRTQSWENFRFIKKKKK
jgi:adenylate cyclase